MAPRYGTMGRNYCTIARSCPCRGASAATPQADARRHIGAGRHAAPGAGTGVDPRQMAPRSAALRNEVVPIPPGLKDILLPICTALADAGRGDSALHIRAAIAAGSIDADSLLGVSLARNQKAIRTSALAHGILARSGLADRRAGQRAAGASPVGWPEGQHYDGPCVPTVMRRSTEWRRRVPTFRSADTGTAGTARSAGRGRRSSKRTAASGRFAARTARSRGRSQRTAASIAETPAAISSPRRRMCSSRNGGSSCADDAAVTRK